MATETCLSSHSFGANITSLEVKINQNRKKHVVQGPPDMTSEGGRRTVFVDGNDGILHQVEDEASVEILDEFDPFGKSPPPPEETTEVMTLTQPKVIYDGDESGDIPQEGILVTLPPSGNEIVNSDPNPIETETFTLALAGLDLNRDDLDPDADVDTARPITRAKTNFQSERKTRPNTRNPNIYEHRPWNGNSFAEALHLDDFETFIASRPENGPRVSDINPVGNIDDDDLCEDGPDSDEFYDENLPKALQARKEQTQPFVVDTAGFREQTRWRDPLGPDESQSKPTQKGPRPRRHNYHFTNPQESSEVDFSDMPKLELNYDDDDATYCMQSEPSVAHEEVTLDEYDRGFHLAVGLTSEQVMDNPEGFPENAPGGPDGSYYPEDFDRVLVARGATAYPTNHNNVGANATGREVNKKTTTTKKKKKTKKKQHVVQGPPVTLDVGDGPTSPGGYDQVPSGLVTDPHAEYPTEDDLVCGLQFGDIDPMGNIDDDFDFREDSPDSGSDELYDEDLKKAIQASKEQTQPFVVDTTGVREHTRWHGELDSDDLDDDLFARGLQDSEERAHPSAPTMNDLSTALSHGRSLYRNRFADQDDMWTAFEQDRELTWAQQETGGVGNTTGEDKKVVEFCDMELAMQLQLEENEQKRKHRSPFRRNNGMDQRRRDPPYRSVSSLLPPASRRGFRTPFEDMLTALRGQSFYTQSRRLQRDREQASGEQLLEGLSDYNDFSANDYEALLELEEKMGDAVHPGLSNSEIDRLPVSVYNTTPAAEGATACGNSAVAFSEHRACKICMCDYEDGDVIRTLPCYHRFHSECIDEWLGRNAVCPICRVKIKEEIGRVR